MKTKRIRNGVKARREAREGKMRQENLKGERYGKKEEERAYMKTRNKDEKKKR